MFLCLSILGRHDPISISILGKMYIYNCLVRGTQGPGYQLLVPIQWLLDILKFDVGGDTQIIMNKIAYKTYSFLVDPNVKAGTYLKRKHTIYVRKYVCTLRRLVQFSIHFYANII